VVLPILHRIKNKSLNLSGYKLNPGLCKAMCIGFQSFQSLINRIQLDNNGMSDEDFA
jgi:hypothetical protein